MDASRFTGLKTGYLVPIEHHGLSDHAFIPDTLPPKWSMSQRLWPLVAEARDVLGRLDGVGSTLPSPRLIIRPLQKREALRSSSLEGTYATPEQLALFEVEKRKKTGPEGISAWAEVHNYYLALREGIRGIREHKPLDCEMIRNLHRTLLTGVRGQTKQPGQFRTYQVHVGSNRRYNPPPADEIAGCMENLEKYTAAPDDDLDPLVRTFVNHYQFEAIHPFGDGNGRVGRLLLSLSICDSLKHSLPWLYVSEYCENNRNDYMSCLFHVSTSGQWDEWIEFCLHATIAQARDASTRITKLNELREKYQSQLEPTSKLHGVVDRLFKTGAIRIVDVQREFNVVYVTAKKYIQELVDKGMIIELPDAYPKTFYASEVFAVAYGDSVV